MILLYNVVNYYILKNKEIKNIMNKNKIDITKYTEDELVHQVFNVEKYYRLLYKKEDFKPLYKKLKNDFKYNYDQITKLKIYIAIN